MNTYIVKNGDNLSTIAQKNGMSLSQLLAMNPQFATNPNRILPGQSVTLSSGNTQSNSKNNPASTTSNTSNNFDPSSLISSLRQQMSNGSISPTDAKNTLYNAYKASTVGSSSGYQETTPSQFQSQLFSPLTINKNGQISQLNSDGSASIGSTTVNQSTQNNTGVTSSTTYQNQNGGSSGTITITDGKGHTATAPAGTAIPSGWTQQGGSTSSTTASDIPTPKSTGNPTLDAAQNAQYQYVTGSLAQGYTINPALTGTSLANMLPQFIQETAAQLEPELLQNFQSEMAGVNNALQTTAKNYESQQGQSIYGYQTNLANLLNTANPYSAGTGATANAMASNENRMLSSLDASYANSQSNTLNAAGAALGQGVPGNFLAGTGATGVSGLSGFGASSVSAPNVNPLRVGVLGGNTVLAGSTSGGNALNYNYNPSNYTYGSIPTTFGQNFGSTLNQLFGNYQKGAAATPTSSQNSGITSSSGLSLGNSVAQGSPQGNSLGWYTGSTGSPVMNP